MLSLYKSWTLDHFLGFFFYLIGKVRVVTVSISEFVFDPGPPQAAEINGEDGVE